MLCCCCCCCICLHWCRFTYRIKLLACQCNYVVFPLRRWWALAITCNACLIRLFQYVMFDVCCVVWLDGVQFLFFAILQRATNSVLFYESDRARERECELNVDQKSFISLVQIIRLQYVTDFTRPKTLNNCSDGKLSANYMTFRI